MPGFFVPDAPAAGEERRISGEDAAHVSRSLRMRVGEHITLVGGGYESDTVIERITPDCVFVRSLSKERCESEPPRRYRLFQCLPKGEKTDTVIQKAVETGVFDITPVISSRVISRPDERSAEGKTARWNRIAGNAAMQCGRGIIPEVHPPVPFAAAAEAMRNMTSFFCWEKGGTPLNEYLQSIPPEGDMAFFIGAEGGISDEEAGILRSNGAVPVWLGHRILRCETCAPFVLACLSYASGMK